MAQRREIPVEWKILVSVSDRFLTGRMEGFIQAELIKQLPASYIWRLWTKGLGDYGTVEITELGQGKTEVLFSGLGFTVGLTDEQRVAKEKHYRDVIASYYFMLSQENVWEGDTPKDISEIDQFKAGLKKIMKINFPIEEWKPWERIPEQGDDGKIIEFLCKGYEIKEIGNKVFREPGTVSNDINRLREYCSEKGILIPDHEQHEKIKGLRKRLSQ